MLSSKCNSKLVKRYYFWKASNFWKCFQTRLSVQLLAKFTRQKFIPLHHFFFLLVPHPAQGDLLYISLIKEIDLQLSWTTLPLIYLRLLDDLKKGRKDRLLLFLKLKFHLARTRVFMGSFKSVFFVLCFSEIACVKTSPLPQKKIGGLYTGYSVSIKRDLESIPRDHVFH